MSTTVLDNLYVEFDEKKSIMHDIFEDVLWMLEICENDAWDEEETSEEWDWDNPRLENLMEQMYVFFKACEEYRSTWYAVKQVYVGLPPTAWDWITSSLFWRELAEINFNEFSITEEFDLKFLYDRIIKMLNFRIPMGREHSIMHFIGMCMKN